MHPDLTAGGRPCIRSSGVSVLGVAVFRRGVARFLAVVLFVVAPGLMVLPFSVAADPVIEGVVSFSDVPESSMFHKEISWLAAEGISTGWDVGGGVRQYRPLDSIARDAMAAFLYRKAGSPAYTPPAVSPFADVASGGAFYKEITWLASQGISTGWDLGGGKREYRPLSPIARDAMAAFLFRFAKPGEFTAPVQSPFADVPAGAAFYKEITWLASAGISTGWDIGGGVKEYRPLNGIARDAMAAFLYRYAAEKVATNPLDPAAGTVTLAPEVQLLEPAALDSATVSGGAVVLPSQDAQDIHPNDVLVSGITPAAPDGLLVRVIQVSRDPAGSTTLTTEPATIPEAVVATSGLLEVSGIPESSTFVPEADVTATSAAASKVAPEALSGQANIFSQSLAWQRTQKAELGSSTLSGSGAVSVTSTVTAAAKARMTLDTSFLQLKETSVIVTPSLTASHSQTFSGSLKGTISAPLGTLWAKFRFMIGPVPVIVTADVEVAANLSVEGDAEVSYTSSNTVSSDHGMKYSNGAFSLINTKPVSTVTDKTVEASKSLTARVSLDFDATIKFYGVAGITFGAGPYASVAIAVVTSNGAKTWSCPMEYGHETRVGVVAGIEILGLKAEWSDITTATWKLAEANPCEGTPVVAPAPDPTPSPTPTPSPSPTPTAPTPVGQPQMVSVTPSGTPANRSSSTNPASISANGRYVVFMSEATDLTQDSGYILGNRNIFVRDMDTGTTTLVSATPEGRAGNQMSQSASISADGRYVVFNSFASDIVPNDNNSTIDVFIRDLATSRTTLVSATPDGQSGGGASFGASVSADGGLVAFHSRAGDLISGYLSAHQQVYVRDIASGTTTAVSVSPNGALGDGDSFDPSISADGHFVAFTSQTKNLISGDEYGVGEVLIRNLQSGALIRISAPPSSQTGSSASYSPALSADGGWVAFISDAPDLAPGDTDGLPGVFRYDTATGATSSISQTGSAWSPSISANGRYVSFHSDGADNFAGDKNGTWDVFVRDTATGSLILASSPIPGTSGNGMSTAGSLSADGRFVAFSSVATDLVPNHSAQWWDVFRTKVSD